MQVLKQSTQVKVVIGPVVAVGDGFTPITGLLLSTADEAEILKHDAAAVTSISAATWAAITSADGYYNLTLSTSHTDTVGMMTVLINDDSLCLPVKATFHVVEEAIYDALFAASATGFDANGRVDVGSWLGTAVTTSATTAKPEVDTFSISNDATAANNAELAFDTTGYGFTGCTMPTVTTLTGHTAQTGDSFARLGAPAGASVSADIAAIEAQTDDIGVAGAGLTAVPWNAAWDAEVQSECNDALVAYGASTHAAADVWAVDATTQQTQGTFGQAIGDPGADADTIWGLVNTNLDAAISSLNDPTAATIADAVWDELATGHTDAGKAGQQLWTDVDAILVDTGDMQPKLGTPAGASISADIAVIEGQTDDIGVAGAGLTAIPWNAAWDVEVESEVVDALTTNTETELAAVPAASPNLHAMVQWVYMTHRNKVTSTATATTVNNDAGSAIGTSTDSDDTTTFTRGEFA